MTMAVIPAAGLGTRFLPATKAMPKEMLPVVDRPTIQYVVEEAVKAGLDDILMIAGRSKRALEDHPDAPPGSSRRWSSRVTLVAWHQCKRPLISVPSTTSARASQGPGTRCPVRQLTCR
jgi:CTP:molybdopterin cytidylyltransferase MocA